VINIKKRVLSSLICFIAVIFCSSSIPASDVSEGKIKNIIYMIPDGGGMSPFYLSDALKQAGGWDREVYPNSTITETEEMYAKKYLAGAITTHSANAEVTDSAAAGTALSSGYKTNNGYVGIDANEVPRANILEAAQYLGKNVGMVTTYEWTNATPAAYSSHEKDRGNYPVISEQIVNQGIDVVLGSGFGAAKWGDVTQAEIRGYDVINTREDLEAVKPGDRIWGNLLPGAFPYDITYSEETPNLSEMTKAAINALDDGNEEGFFLMVEGSRVDGGGHANYVRGMVGEFLAFDEACKVALQYAESRNDTMVIIVPDHDTGGMNLPDNLEKAVNNLKKGEEPADITWETTSHTARHGGLFIYVPEGIKYPEGISGSDIGTHKAFEENVVDNTVIAPYIAAIMGVDLDSVTEKLFVDVTDMGKYDDETGLFVFREYPISVHDNVSYAYVGNDVADLNGQVTLRINDRFYVPAILLDIAEGRVDYEKCEYVYPVEAYMEADMSEAVYSEKMSGSIRVVNLMADEKLTGEIKFTYPRYLAETEFISISVDGASSNVYNFEFMNYNIGDDQTQFEYDIITDSGQTYSFKSTLKGITYAGYSGSKIDIDGIIDEEAWNGSFLMTCDDASKIVMIENWKGDRDLSGEFSVLWDEDYLYFYAAVTDEIFYPEKASANLRNGDSVLIGVYNDKQKELINGDVESDFEEIGLAFIDNRPVAYRFTSQTGGTKVGEIESGEHFDMACVREGDDITYEMKIKWSMLFGYDYVPQKDDILGFSALINDNDGEGKRGWMEFGSGIGKERDVNQFVVMPLLDLEKIGETEIFINGKKIKSDVLPKIIDGRTLVPARAIFEAMGAEVDWEEETKTVLINMNNTIISVRIGDKTISVNGKVKEIDVPAQIVNERTLVPLRAISESSGFDVDWDARNKAVIIEG